MADMIIIDKNPLEIEPQALKELKVLETIKQGKSVYQTK
jgi:predicted amidohydrolase YtcJ